MILDGLNIEKIIQADRSELFMFINNTEQLSQIETEYAKVIYYFLESNINQLQIAVNLLNQNFSHSILAQFALFRLKIRTENFSEDELNNFISLSTDSDLLSGEKYFIAAMAAEKLNHLMLMKECDFKAYSYFSNAGCQVKAFKALHNYICSLVQIEPEKSYINEYQLLYSQSKNVVNTSTKGNILTNLSIEYNKIGNYNTSYVLIQKALRFLESDFSSKQYQTALAQRCYLNFKLGKQAETHEDLNLLNQSQIEYIKNISLVLKSIINKDFTLKNKIINSPINYHWKQKLIHEFKSNLDQSIKFTKMEQALINCLSERALDKFELIQILYPHETNFLNSENKLNNLLFRLRKKQANLISLVNNKYTLNLRDSA